MTGSPLKCDGTSMIQPLDPLAFLKLAQELANRDEKEVRLRTAVGRAYYALFLIARDKLRIRARRDVHKKTINALKKRRGYLTTANQLDALKRLRLVADYELLPHNKADRNWIHNWSRVQALVNQVLPKLTRLRR